MKPGLFCQANLLITSIPSLIHPQGPVITLRAMEKMAPAKARSVTQGHDPLYLTWANWPVGAYQEWFSSLPSARIPQCPG